MTSAAAHSEDFQEAMERVFQALKAGKTEADVGRVLEQAEAARRLNPNSAEPLFALGLAAFRLNDIGGAIRLMEEAHKLDPDGREIAEALAAFHGRAGNLSDSLYYTKLAMTLDENPRFARVLPETLRDFEANIEAARQSAYLVEAQFAFLLREYADTVSFCRRELELHPQNAEAYQLMGRAMLELRKYEDGVGALETAARLSPRDAMGFAYLAEGLLKQGRLDMALEYCREAVRLDPASAAVRGQMLSTLAYLPGEAWRGYPQEAASAIGAIAPGPRPAPPPLAVDPKTITQERRAKTRIVYLIGESTMLRDIGFLESVLAHHDHRRFFVKGYQQYSRPFSDTTRLQKHADEWRQVYNIDDETLALIVANDAIDVLIDLCGTSADARPAFLARRPAPIQVSWLGFPQGSLPGTVDWLVSNAAIREFDERDGGGIPLIGLDGGLFAYNGAPVEIMGDGKGSSPAVANGFVTFGAVFDPARVAVSAPFWSEVLRRVPGARLLLGRAPLADEATRARVRSFFPDKDVAQRIVFPETPEGKSPVADFYASVDIVLDSLPVNGMVELCEALWLGIPVVGCRGDRRAGALGVGILEAAGRREWVATTGDEFATIAQRLAADIPGLADLRKTLPGQVEASRLGDGKTFTAKWEAVLDVLVGQARGQAAARSGK